MASLLLINQLIYIEHKFTANIKLYQTRVLINVMCSIYEITSENLFERFSISVLSNHFFFEQIIFFIIFIHCSFDQIV